MVFEFPRGRMPTEGSSAMIHALAALDKAAFTKARVRISG